MTNEEYAAYAASLAPRSPLLRDTAAAFAVGGGICAAAQLLCRGCLALGMAQEDASCAVSVTLVLLGALLTGLNLYNSVARFAGAGTLVPITGFANAVASGAIDFRTEGVVTGMAAKMFTVAGPVIVFGTLASALYGAILLLL